MMACLMRRPQHAHLHQIWRQVGEENLGRRIGDHAGRAAHGIGDGRADLFKRPDPADIEIVLPPSALSGGIDDDRTCEEVSVRNDDITLVVGPDDGGAGLNLFHSSLVGIDLDLVAHVKGFGPQQKKAGKKVLQDVLESKAAESRRALWTEGDESGFVSRDIRPEIVWEI